MNYFWAFVVGGGICVIGQLLIDLTGLTPARILTGYVVAGVILSAVGWYAPLAEFAGCGATVPLVADNPLGWQLSVSGDVESAFTASVGDLANEESTSKVMTCTCGGNPAGGRAIVTADVTGIPVEHLLAKAGAEPGANAVTFVSADGTQQTFPLGYVVGRHAVLSYEINDEDLSASVGGSNQLWMTKTPANYFVRDVVEIVVSTEDVAPATPGAADEHPNSPNAGVLAGTQG